MKAKLALGVVLLAACSEGGSWVRPSPGGSERASSPATEASGDVAGGETSEFTGGGDPCDEIASSEPVALDDPEVASWVAMAQGHHEQTLGWRRLVLSDEVVGYEEHTSVSIDVNVLGGRDIVYGSGGTPELSGCDGLRDRQIELEITLATADGAVATTYRNWFQPAATDTRGMVLRPGGFNIDGAGVIDLSGTLELRPEPALGGTPLFWLDIELSADSVRGSLVPVLMPEDSAWNLSLWGPIEAVFPDDPCGSQGRSIGLDEPFTGLISTPRALYEHMVRTRGRETLPAVWARTPYRTEPSPSDVPLDACCTPLPDLSLSDNR